MSVREISSREEFQTILEGSNNTLIIVDFSATWCGPCQYIKPHFQKLAEQYTDLIFLSVDVDELDDLSSECGVNAMPTFQFYKNNNKLIELRGANLDELKSNIAQLK